MILQTSLLTARHNPTTEHWLAFPESDRWVFTQSVAKNTSYLSKANVIAQLFPIQESEAPVVTGAEFITEVCDHTRLHLAVLVALDRKPFTLILNLVDVYASHFHYNGIL